MCCCDKQDERAETQSDSRYQAAEDGRKAAIERLTGLLHHKDVAVQMQAAGMLLRGEF